MAEAPGRRDEGSARQGKSRRKPVRTPKSSTRASTARPKRAESRHGNGWLELVTTLVQAPVGIGRSQAERLVGELVKTGNLGERAQGRALSAADGLDRFIENRIEDVLNRVNIPSRSDIERLNKSVDVLTAKVETLLGRHERSGH